MAGDAFRCGRGSHSASGIAATDVWRKHAVHAEGGSRTAGSPPAIIDNFQVSAQWSRRMNSLKLWLTLRVHGRRAYEELIDRQMKLAAFFANWVRSSEQFELAAPQVLPIINLRVKFPNAREDCDPRRQ